MPFWLNSMDKWKWELEAWRYLELQTRQLWQAAETVSGHLLGHWLAQNEVIAGAAKQLPKLVVVQLLGFCFGDGRLRSARA